MTTPAQELGTLSPDAVIELFEVDLNNIGNNTVVCFWNHRGGEAIAFDGKVYTAWPIEMSDSENSTDGPLPAPVVTLGNQNGVVSSLLDLYRPQGAIFRRRQVLRKNLDDGSDPNPSAQFRPEEFFLDRWTETERYVSLMLETALAYLTTEIPARQIANIRSGE